MGLPEKNIKKLVKMPKGSGLTKPLKLSSDLADIVGKKEASRAECIKELWAYLKKHNLQTSDNKQFFLPDKKMAKVFGSDKSVLSVCPSILEPICPPLTHKCN